MIADQASAPVVAIVATGTANLASIAAAFVRLGASPMVTREPALVDSAPLLVLPGVGAFAPAIKQLRSDELEQPLLKRIREGRPLLAICLGMQLLCDASDESPGIPGLGVVPAVARRFEPSAGSTLRVPHMGWNRVTPTATSRMIRDTSMYFANSYRIAHVPEGWAGATTSYVGTFASAIERGSILACQFHPELSGQAGSDLLQRWMRASRTEGATC